MSGPIRLITEPQQGFSFSRRAFVLGGSMAGLGAILAARMTYLSVYENDKYRLLAESNRVNLTLIPPRRGWLVDRHGAPIANNRTDFRVDIIPDRLEDKGRVLAQLSQLLKLTAEDVARIEDDLKGASGFQPVAVAENLDWERFAAVSVRLPELPGVAPTRGFARSYPAGAAVGHLVGYVGTATAEQFKATKDTLLLTPGFKLGKDGLEKMLEDQLRGKAGAKRVEVTARGKLVRELATRPDEPGQTVRLTVDAGLQEFTARRLGNESGSCTVFDVLTGDILAMVSMPSYDPNAFSDGISRSEWKMLSQDDHLPLMNKTLQGLYPPGSTFKPATALAILGAGIDPRRTVNCNGGYTLGNRRFGCLGRHGPMTMHTAIARSCNTYFYTLGREIGIEPIAAAARKLGFGAEFDLPLPSQRYGTIPDTAWKMRRYKQDWTQADTLNASIGQGYVLVSPFQLALSAARLASGRALLPALIAGKRPQAPHLAFPDEHLAIVRGGMDEVVNGRGTAGASKLQLDGIRMGGKTGTAQVRRIMDRNRGQGGDWKYRDHGLFVCFAPVDNPRYAASVVIEHGMGGARAAAPVAKDVLTWLFDKQKALDSLAAFERAWGGDIRTRMAAKEAAFRASNGLAPIAPSATPGASATPTLAPSPAATPAPAPTATPSPSPSPGIPA
ncbi:penicillin-binding protein 2 [Sphingomonas turrisvirgatae]|uniref:Penicillin-binding protein 2 n=1 Tax=Sphingomonas turrisvirgatae TaxID=1888892 RepID=A0A1E3LRK2_9SPHN|nr:penicillin-binding protein 2 [Sphingomonas turrisvirgatae]ODP36353.1 penicillin-binding protein 2 [Sphingomonas turrisvirgatae]